MTATALKLRCPLADCATMTLSVPSGGVTGGQMAKVQSTVGAYLTTDATAGNLVAFVYSAKKIVVPKDAGSGITFAAGDPVYFNDSTKKATNVSSGNTFCGTALEAAVGAATEVEIELDGSPRS